MAVLTLLLVDGKENFLRVFMKILLMLLQGTFLRIGPRPTGMMLLILVSAPTVQEGLKARERSEKFAVTEGVAEVSTFKVP